jgi:WD40 repeat protein
MKKSFADIKQIALTDDIVKEFNTGEIFKVHQKEINSIDFSPDRSQILTSGKDDMICVIDIDRREIQKKLYNKTFGVENAIFTHDKSNILCSSKIDCKCLNNVSSNNVLVSSQ